VQGLKAFFGQSVYAHGVRMRCIIHGFLHAQVAPYIAYGAKGLQENPARLIGVG
jgi:hypothetical protein